MPVVWKLEEDCQSTAASNNNYCVVDVMKQNLAQEGLTFYAHVGACAEPKVQVTFQIINHDGGDYGFVVNGQGQDSIVMEYEAGARITAFPGVKPNGKYNNLLTEWKRDEDCESEKVSVDRNGIS